MKFYPKYILNCLIISFLVSNLPAQEIADPKEAFSEGEFFFLAEEYEEALYFYLQVLNTDPDNPNFNFKVGNSYLNISGQEHKAIPFLEKAVTNTTVKYKKKSFTEKKAPHYAIFYLGNAYRINNQLDKALDTYQSFINSEDFEGNYNVSMVETQIRACERAKIIQDVPVKFELIKLEAPVNSAANTYNPVLSGDGNIMVYVTELKFYDAIHLSRKINGNWTEPEVLNPQVGSDGDMYPTSLSFDGKELYLVKEDDNNSDIFVSRLEGTFWSKAQALGPTINSRTHETHASLTADGNYLFFTSARRDGFGGLDIYRSGKTSAGEWGEAVNLGAVINTELDEETPFLSDNGKRLFFSSQGHFNMGGFDIFYADLKADESWGDPVNIGFPVNTTSDNLFYYPVGDDGSTGYYAAIGEEGPLVYNIFRVNIIDRGFEFTNLSPSSRFNHDFIIEVINPSVQDTLIIKYDRKLDSFISPVPSLKINIKNK